MIFKSELNYCSDFVRKHKELSKAEEKSLFIEAKAAEKAGDYKSAEQIYEKLAADNMGYVLKCLTSMYGFYNENVPDAFWECFMVMKECARRFDVEKSNGGRLIAYAKMYISNAIQNTMREFTSEMTEDDWKLRNAVSKWAEKYMQYYETEYIDVLDLAQFMIDNGYRTDLKDDAKQTAAEKLVDKIRMAEARAAKGVSIETGNDAEDSEDGSSLEGMIAGGSCADDDLMYEEEKQEFVDKLVRELGDRDAHMMLDFYGYELPYSVSRGDLEFKYNVSNARITQIKEKAERVLAKRGIRFNSTEEEADDMEDDAEYAF